MANLKDRSKRAKKTDRAVLEQYILSAIAFRNSPTCREAGEEERKRVDRSVVEAQRALDKKYLSLHELESCRKELMESQNIISRKPVL